MEPANSAGAVTLGPDLESDRDQEPSTGSAMRVVSIVLLACLGLGAAILTGALPPALAVLAGLCGVGLERRSAKVGVFALIAIFAVLAASTGASSPAGVAVLSLLAVLLVLPPLGYASVRGVVGGRTLFGVATLGAFGGALGTVVDVGIPLAGLCLCVGVFAIALARPGIRATRPMIALAFGLAGAWLGVAVNVDCFDLSREPRSSAVLDHPDSARAEWLSRHGVTDAHFETTAVTGFPLQRIEGSIHARAHWRLPAEKGLGALLANLAIWTVLGGVLAFSLRRDRLRPALGVLGATAFVCVSAGGWRLLWLLE